MLISKNLKSYPSIVTSHNYQKISNVTTFFHFRLIYWEDGDRTKVKVTSACSPAGVQRTACCVYSLSRSEFQIKSDRPNVHHSTTIKPLWHTRWQDKESSETTNGNSSASEVENVDLCFVFGQNVTWKCVISRLSTSFNAFKFYH